MVKGWASGDTVGAWSRQKVLDANDLLDAMEEAEEDAHKEAKKASEKKRV